MICLCNKIYREHIKKSKLALENMRTVIKSVIRDITFMRQRLPFPLRILPLSQSNKYTCNGFKARY